MRSVLVFLVPIAGWQLGGGPRGVRPTRSSRCDAPLARQWRQQPQEGFDPENVGQAFSGDAESIRRDSDLVFACLDTDGNGVVSKDEMCAHLIKAGYAASDAESWFAESASDGVITPEALRSAFLNYPELRSTPGLGSTEFDGEIPEAVRMDATNFIFDADVTRDGEITQPEMEQHMVRLGFNPEAITHVFEQLDLNSDGVLSRDELAEVFLKYSALRLALR